MSANFPKHVDSLHGEHTFLIRTAVSYVGFAAIIIVIDLT